MKELRTFATAPRSETAISRPCPLCRSTEHKKTWSAQGAIFLRCSSCGLWRQDPQPLPGAIFARYDEHYLEYETARHLEYREIALKSLAQAGLYPVAPVSLERPEILEIGCATGALLSSFDQGGWRTCGVEVGAAMAAYARKTFGIDVKAGTLERMKFADSRFDVVMALHLVEHLNDPDTFLDELRRIIKPGGSLYLITPNTDSFQGRLMGQSWRSAIRDHLYLFSVKTLGALLKGHGFSLEYNATWGGWPAGMKPAFLKKPLDAVAKSAGIGDVMILRARPV